MLLIFFACSGLGLVKSNAESQRLRLLKEWQRATLLLMQEISYHETLMRACQHVGQRIKSPFRIFFERIAKRLEAYEGTPFAQVFSEEVENILKNSYLNNEDCEVLKLLGEMIQDSDRSMQAEILKRHNAEMDVKIMDLREKLPEKQELYRSLGILGGLFLSILVL